MADIDPKKLQVALDKAFDEAINNLVKQLLANLVDAHSRNPTPGLLNAEQSQASFGRQLKITWDAYNMASAKAEQIAKAAVA